VGEQSPSFCGRSSGVEHLPSKQNVARSNRVVRSKKRKHMPKPTQEDVLKQTKETLKNVIDQYIEKFGLNHEEKDIEKMVLLEVSAISDMTYDGILATLAETIKICSKLEAEAGAEYFEMVRWKKSLAEIGSIMHISRSHPESAIKRLTKMIEKPVRDEYVLKPDF
jgi:hypothetical protein